jgi:hypothetical protein
MPLRKIHPKAAKMENPEMLRKQMVALSQELNRVLEQLASLRDSSDAAIIGSLGTNVEALAAISHTGLAKSRFFWHN